MKIRAQEVELIHADRLTDEPEETNINFHNWLV